VYLLKGDRYLLVGGAGPWIVPDLERQFADLGVDLERIDGIYLSHSHFDHCGAVPYLRRRIPQLRVYASAGTAAILAHEKALLNMRRFTRESLEQMGSPLEFRSVSLDFEPFRLTRVLRDGDAMDLGGGVRLTFFETPGHSRCSMTAYEARRGWLFPGDSMPFPSADGSDLVSTASESFVVFCGSLRKLQGLETSLCAWEHHGVRTQADARAVVRDALDFTARYKASVRDLLARTGDPARAAEEVCRNWLAHAQFPFLPERVMLHIARTIVSNASGEEL
jgi:glyoxylase-like metal-dependent hydrolase (beta-lactamase superfamily II)